MLLNPKIVMMHQAIIFKYPKMQNKQLNIISMNQVMKGHQDLFNKIKISTTKIGIMAASIKKIKNMQTM